MGDVEQTEIERLRAEVASLRQQRDEARALVDRAMTEGLAVCNRERMYRDAMESVAEVAFVTVADQMRPAHTWECNLQFAYGSHECDCGGPPTGTLSAVVHATAERDLLRQRLDAVSSALHRYGHHDDSCAAEHYVTTRIERVSSEEFQTDPTAVMRRANDGVSVVVVNEHEETRMYIPSHKFGECDCGFDAACKAFTPGGKDVDRTNE